MIGSYNGCTTVLMSEGLGSYALNKPFTCGIGVAPSKHFTQAADWGLGAQPPTSLEPVPMARGLASLALAYSTGSRLVSI